MDGVRCNIPLVDICLGRILETMKKSSKAIVLGAVALAWSPTLAIGSEFSWHALTGCNPSSFTSALSEVARCSKQKPHEFTLPKLSADTKISDDLHRPVSGSWMTQERFRSTSITVIECKLGDKAQIWGYSFQDQVFQILVRYPRCTGIDCDWSEQEFDRKLYAAFGKDGGYGHTGLGFDPSDYGSSYLSKYSSLRSNPYFDRKLEDADTGCWPGRNPSYSTNLLYKCLIAGAARRNRWQSLSMLEIYEDGWLSDKLLGRLAIRQEFTLVPIERAAHNEFLNEVRSFVRHRLAEQSTKEKVQEDKEFAIDGALGSAE